MILHRSAQLLAFATFILLLVGGLVHGTGSGLACPDWPLCFGSAFPEMKGHVLYEHSHRLVAGTVALLTVVLAVAIWVSRRRGPSQDRRLVALGFGAVGLVVVQALLGALTVWLKLPALVSTAHLAVSMLFFSLILYLAARLHPHWNARRVPLGRRERNWLGWALLATYGQILLGGLVRHTGSGLACIDFPLCQGSILPLGAHPSVILQAVHRLMAVLVAIMIVFGAVGLLRSPATAQGPARFLRGLALLLPILVGVQVTLGAMSVLSYLELYRVTSHLAVAALLLATLVTLWLRTQSAASEVTS
ncbi:MAG TPA: COX15/CtaA family protein [Polyangia bacterium]|nr:COX15/CtaA family protein [Polyangia bacterium]